MASTSGKIRFVRCPKCLQLLTEYSTIPLYQCGGCDAVLKAKNRNVNGENPELNLDETQNPLSNSSENVSPDSFSIFSTEPNNTPSSNAHPSEPSEDELKATPITRNSPTEKIFDQPKVPKEQTSNVEEEDTMSRCSNACDGSISSSDECKIKIQKQTYHLQKSKTTVRKKEPAGDKQKEKEGLPPRLPKDKSGKRYGNDEAEEGVSLDSSDFQIIQSLIESDAPHPFLVDRYRKTDRHERLTKLNELRDKLNKYIEQRGTESLYHQEGIDSIQRLLYQNPKSQESPLCFDSRHNTNQLKPPYPYVPPPLPSHSACMHFRNGIFRPGSCNLCASSSFPGSPTSTGQDSAKSSSKDRRSLMRKHICRPIFGGTPYVICENCFTLLQVPSTILISKKRLVQLQCGNCSDVLTVPLPSNNFSKKNVAIDLHGTIMQGDPANLNKNCSAFASSSRSYSTGRESAFKGEEGDIEAALPALHRLMGYSSATELLYSRRDVSYDSFESMVPLSYTQSRNT